MWSVNLSLSVLVGLSCNYSSLMRENEHSIGKIGSLTAGSGTGAIVPLRFAANQL